MKRPQITLRISSVEEHDGYCYTQVKARNRGFLGAIHFLEDEDGHGFYYNIELPSGWWLEKTFDTELEAIRHLASVNKLSDMYRNIYLRMGYYCNSERGAITYHDNIQNINLAA